MKAALMGIAAAIVLALGWFAVELRRFLADDERAKRERWDKL